MSSLSPPVSPAIAIDRVTFRYGDRIALEDVSLAVAAGDIFGLLGPNGGGKTTLFRLLSTLLPLQQGHIRLDGLDSASAADAVRRRIGVTFQSPSLDARLTVRENLIHQGHLYGLHGRDLTRRIELQTRRLGIGERLSDRAGDLSGGLKRRVEIAKGLLHEPRILLLDEPSTGLDPGARLDLWQMLRKLRDEAGTTILVTTHLMDEAERCDRLAILDRGRIVAEGGPAELRMSIGGDCLTLATRDPADLAERIQAQFGVVARLVDGSLRIEHERGHALLNELREAFPDDVTMATLGRPTLEDVFVARTGRRFLDEEGEPVEGVKSSRKKRRG